MQSSPSCAHKENLTPFRTTVRPTEMENALESGTEPEIPNIYQGDPRPAHGPLRVRNVDLDDNSLDFPVRRPNSTSTNSPMVRSLANQGSNSIESNYDSIRNERWTSVFSSSEPMSADTRRLNSSSNSAETENDSSEPRTQPFMPIDLEHAFILPAPPSPFQGQIPIAALIALAPQAPGTVPPSSTPESYSSTATTLVPSSSESSSQSRSSNPRSLYCRLCTLDMDPDEWYRYYDATNYNAFHPNHRLPLNRNFASQSECLRCSSNSQARAFQSNSSFAESSRQQPTHDQTSRQEQSEEEARRDTFSTRDDQTEGVQLPRTCRTCGLRSCLSSIHHLNRESMEEVNYETAQQRAFQTYIDSWEARMRYSGSRGLDQRSILASRERRVQEYLHQQGRMRDMEPSHVTSIAATIIVPRNDPPVLRRLRRREHVDELRSQYLAHASVSTTINTTTESGISSINGTNHAVTTLHGSEDARPRSLGSRTLAPTSAFSASSTETSSDESEPPRVLTVRNW